VTFGRLVLAGVALVASGGALVATAELAAAATPTISFKQTAPLAAGATVLVKVKGSGFTASSIGGLFECSTATGQPTIDVKVFSGATSIDAGQIPISCRAPQTVVTTSAGAFPSTSFGLTSGHLGPPATGLDSAGTMASNDAASYPCPPTASQGSTAGCELLFIDGAGEKASAAIEFGFQTTTTSSVTPTTSASCTGKSNSFSAPNPKTGTNPTVTVNPATCLVSGQTVTVTAQGLQPSSIGSLLECSSDGSNAIYAGTDGATVQSIVSASLDTSDVVGAPDKSGSLTLVASGGNAQIAYTSVTVSGTNATFSGLSLSSGTGTWTVAAGAVVTEGQPTVSFLKNAIPVSCTQVKTFTTNSDGTIATADQQFTIEEGTTGPPCSASGATMCDSPSDSAGNDPSTDAANFPCPPTAAQTAAGVGCVIAVGDLAGDKVPVPISFNIGGTPIPTTTTTEASSSGTLIAAQNTTGGSGSSTGAATSASGTLAYTGAGAWMWMVGLLGTVFVLLGAALLVLVDAPRRIVLAGANWMIDIRRSSRTRS